MIIRIVAADIPRDTVKAALARSRNGRGEPSRLTEDINGHYYAVVDDSGAASDFCKLLDGMTAVRHQEVASLPRKPKPDIRTFRLGSTGNPRVDGAFAEYVAVVIEDLTDGVRQRRAGVRLF
jgi:hypothetical protein